MIFKGFRFRKNARMVSLPIKDIDGNLMPYVSDNRENYVYFGKTLLPNQKKTINAVKTNYTWSETGEPVWAIPLELNGHSLTNMAYGTKGEVYLMFDGSLFQAKIHKTN